MLRYLSPVGYLLQILNSFFSKKNFTVSTTKANQNMASFNCKNHFKANFGGCCLPVIRVFVLQFHLCYLIFSNITPVYRPVASLMIIGGRLSQIWDRFQCLKIGILTGYLWETPILKITTIDDVTLWSKLKSTWYR